MRRTAHHSSKGFVLASAMLIVLLLAGISVGTLYLVNTESQLAATDLDSSRAFYGAEAAMEKTMVDLNSLYGSILSPTVSDIEGLGDSSYQPVLSGITYPSYQFTIPNNAGEPITEVRTISSGPNEGLTAYVTPLTIAVTARTPTGSEVKMEREIQMALIPVFQFGVFSDVDLAYHPGPGFNFSGRVHTNGDLYLCSSNSSGLVFHNKITAVGDIIRAEMMNGLNVVTEGRDDPIWIPTAPAGCDGTEPYPACRDLQEDEGSKVGGPASADNSNWSTLSLTDYNGFVVNGDTGAKAMELPFVGPGVSPKELVLRPPAGEDPNSVVGGSRLYNMAQLRVLISDTAAENPGGAGVQLIDGSYGPSSTTFAEGRDSYDSDFIEPPGVTAGDPWPLVDGYLLVQSKQLDGSYDDVTMEWLNLGIAREDADAILKFEELKDDDGDGTAEGTDLSDRRDVLQLGLYDAREGEIRDISQGAGNSNCAIGGIINIVELDVGNLKRWLEGTTGATGTDVESVSQNGYVFYFSDRRGMLPDPNLTPPRITGEYGWEDVINLTAAGVPNGVLETGEDVNQDGEVDTYGAANIGDAFGFPGANPAQRIDCNTIGRKNRVSGPRHGLKLVNGSLGSLPLPGFTVATENMVCVVGNYNADDAGFGDPHSSAAIIADTANFLSQNWEDWRSIFDAANTDAGTTRTAVTSYYRVAVAAGKPINWPNPQPAWGDSNYGNDGGTHNFLRYLERWSGQTFNYRGSLVSLYYSTYATGTFKYDQNTVYTAPTRDYEFDEDFLELNLLPPGTPRFRDVVNLGFRQVLTPD